MSKLSTFILVACMASAGVMTAQPTKTVHVETAGTLSTLLTETEKTTVTDLTVTGNIDPADIYFMASLMYLDWPGGEAWGVEDNPDGVLLNIDFSGATVSGDSIPNGAFQRRTLGQITVPNSISVIGKHAFDYIPSDAPFEFRYPTGLKTIRFGAFMDCAGFSNFDFPEGLETIEQSAFLGCAQNVSKPPTVTIPSTVTSIEDYAFYQNKIREVKIPFSSDSLTIKQMAFAEIENLTTVTLPAKLKSLEDYVFDYVPGLEKVYNHSENPLKISKNVFSGASFKDVTLYVPEASIDAYKVATGWKEFGTIEAIDATAVPAVKTTGTVYCHVADNALTVKGLTGTAALTLTGLNGKTLLRKAVSSDVSIPLNGLSKGVYVVRIGDKTFKVIKK